MTPRRDFVVHSLRLAALLAGAGLLPRAARAGWTAAAFESKNLADAMRALGSSGLAPSNQVTLTTVDIADNGAAVPMVIATTLPGVRRLALVVEKNPNALAAVFEVGDAVEPSLSTRIKMGQSSNVHAVALMADGRALFTTRDVRVTLGGCG